MKCQSKERARLPDNKLSLPECREEATAICIHRWYSCKKASHKHGCGTDEEIIAEGGKQ